MEYVVKNSILIVDDEKSNLLYLNHILGAEYTIYIARDGLEAIQQANEYLPDLILLDIILPGMDGYEVLSVLKKAERTREIPVIFLSGFNNSEDEKKGLVFGAEDFISKPFIDVIVQLRIRNQLKIVNQMRALDKRLKQQTLMSAIAQSFLMENDIDTLLKKTLRMAGEFMEIAQILLFMLEEDGSTLLCQNEWINPAFGLPSRIGGRMPLKEPMLSIIKSIKPGNDKDACLSSNEPVFKSAMAPYRVNFQNYIATPFFVKGEMIGVLDFSRESSDWDWSDSEITLATLFACILSGVFEREAIA